ncbi:MAG: hypothetical protein KC417_17550, partial [Myxococcales bacterium]|nr:hypothetical protein [Myxococcales bacterium]
MLPSAIAEATAAFDRALRGDLGPTLALLDALDASSDPVTVAWKQKLHAAASLLAADEDPLFEAPRDTLAAGETLDGPGALLCDEIQGLKALRAFIAFRGLGNSDSAPRHGFGTASDAWHRLLRGEGPPEAVMDGLIAEAVRAKSSARLVEATAVASLAALSEGKLDRAVMLARRGSRMARTEELCAHAYLANLVLARARRITGFPSQALRIAGALSAVVPSPWQHWVRWEQAMAGHLDGLGAEAEDPRACVRDLLAAAKSGDRVRFEALGQSLVELAGDWVDAQRDAHALLFSLDPARQSQDPTMGRALHAPMAVHLRSFGASITSAEDGSAGVRVYAAPGQVTCRILESGVGFLPPGFEPVAL